MSSGRRLFLKELCMRWPEQYLGHPQMSTKELVHFLQLVLSEDFLFPQNHCYTDDGLVSPVEGYHSALN